jgi:rare lipoprotein A
LAAGVAVVSCLPAFSMARADQSEARADQSDFSLLLPGAPALSAEPRSETAHEDWASGRSKAARGGGQTGLATWYGPGFHGRKTASGERFNTHAMTAAHRSLPFGTRVEVVNQATGRSVVVRINDRGPYRRGAVIDLSRASATAIGMDGIARVRLVSLGG